MRPCQTDPPHEPTYEQLADSPIDVLSIHLPAVTPQTYTRRHWIDAYASVLTNIRGLLARQSRGSVVPAGWSHVRQDERELGEMEAW